jgi:hypothetical protein
MSPELVRQVNDRTPHIVVHASGGLSQADVNRLVAEARARESEDKAMKEQKAVVRQLDGLVTNMMLSVQALESVLSPDEQQRILDAIEGAKEARADASLEELKMRLSEIERAAGIVGQAMLRPSPGGESIAEPPAISAMTRLLGTMDAMPIRWHGEVVGRFEPTEFETLGPMEIKQRGRLIWAEGPATKALLARLRGADRRFENAGVVEVDRPKSHVRAFLSLVSPSTREALLYMRVQR